jgi:signal transduction histidine kinase
MLISFINNLIGWGLDTNLSYIEQRKIKLLNVINFSLIFILIVFSIYNLVLNRQILLLSDLIVICAVCVPIILLQKKKKYIFARYFLTISLFTHTSIFAVYTYEQGVQLENILIACSLIPIFLFSGYAKNILFLTFLFAFFIVKFLNYHLFGDTPKIDTYYAIYAIAFFVIYLVASFFKFDIENFSNKLHKSLKTKDTIFQIIAHDIKNPFTSLLGFSNLQLNYIKKNQYEKIENSAKIINEATSRIYFLTQTLLDWSLTQSKDFKINAIDVSIQKLISESIEICNPIAITKNINIILLPNNDIQYKCDKIITQIAIRNILLNAIKFSHKNSSIEIDYKLNKSNELIIRIKDEGIGMTKKEIETIFDDNTLLQKDGTNSESGTGIGIRISLDLIKKQGGDITIDSIPNKGSIFSIKLK